MAVEIATTRARAVHSVRGRSSQRMQRPTTGFGTGREQWRTYGGGWGGCSPPRGLNLQGAVLQKPTSPLPTAPPGLKKKKQRPAVFSRPARSTPHARSAALALASRSTARRLALASRPRHSLSRRSRSAPALGLRALRLSASARRPPPRREPRRPPPPVRQAPGTQDGQIQQGSRRFLTLTPSLATRAAGSLRNSTAQQLRNPRLQPRQYAYEVQLMEAERQRKAGARAEAARIANQERKAAKLAAAETRAAERRAFEEDFRQTLMKERAEKLESWRKKEKLKEQKKAEQKELLRKKSSMWLSEDKIEQQILTAIMQTTPL